MAIEFQVTSLDTVGEELRGVYNEVEGGFVLDPDKYAEYKATGLKKKNQELIGREKSLKDQFTKFERFKPLTESPEEELEKFFDAWEKRNEKTAEPSGGQQKVTQLDIEAKERAHARELKKRDEEAAKTAAELTQARNDLREYRLWTPLQETFVKAGGDPADWEVARLELAAQKRFDFDEDGKIVVMNADGYADTITPEKFFKDIYSDQRPKFYKATGAAGSGAANNTASRGNGKTMRREEFDNLPQTERMKIARDGVIKVVD